MFYILFTVHLAICVAIIGLVLLQQGKGAEAGALVSSANSDSIFGPGSAPSFFTKLTTGLAIAFMISSVLLLKNYSAQGPLTGKNSSDILSGSVLERVAVPEATTETKKAE